MLPKDTLISKDCPKLYSLDDLLETFVDPHYDDPPLIRYNQS